MAILENYFLPAVTYHSLISPAKRKRVTEVIDARARSVPRHGPRVLSSWVWN